DDLECEICSCNYDTTDHLPQKLPCDHIFCCKCLAKECTNGKNRCPTCRIPHNENSVEEIEISFLEGCPKHKKSLLYYYCHTHCLQICRQCTVTEHSDSECKITSIKEKLEGSKEDNICQANSTVIEINDIISALDDFVKKKESIISNLEVSIQKWKKEIEDATKSIANEIVATSKAENESYQGKVKV
ncbi:unnamed protein product, partial [Meganyctiphanes norvegica]